MVPIGLAACGLVVTSALAYLIWTGYIYSLQFESGAPWDGYAPGLKPGWLFGRRIDLSDTQWREFRYSAPYLCAVLIVFAVLSRMLQRQMAGKASAARITARALYYVAFAAIFLIYLHGITAVYVFALVAANWSLAQAVAGTKFGALTIWLANIAALLGARITDGFPPSMLLGPHFAWLDQHRGVMRWHICYNLTVLRMLSFALDLHWSKCAAKGVADGGAMNEEARVEPNAGATNREDEKKAFRDAEYSKAFQERNKSNTTNGSLKHLSNEREMPNSPRGRQTTSLPSQWDYRLLLAMAHALYIPLYLAGPIISFQDFVWQLHRDAKASTSAPQAQSPAAVPATMNHPKLAKDSKNDATVVPSTLKPHTVDAPLQQSLLVSQTADSAGTLHLAKAYIFRLLADICCIELLTHTMYFNSLAVHRIGKRYASHGLSYHASEVGLTAWWVLSFMWLKFAVLWRIFRLGALLEGIDPPENMLRCFANNYDIEGFWKGWHSSYNRWLVRYMYVPMGGSRFRVLSIWPIFLFVALWHDLEWRLLSWAWLICVAFLPELAVKRCAASKRFDGWRGTGSYTALAAAMAAVNCAGLMAANMVGFVVGPGGMSDLFKQLFQSPRYVSAVLVSFYCAMHLNFEFRRREVAKALKARV